MEEGAGGRGTVTWARIDDDFFSHPKAVKAGIEGRALFMVAICYSAHHLTDGYVAQELLPVLGAMAGVKDAAKTADLLVRVGLFEEAEDGYAIHDYLDYNTARTTVVARAAAGQRGGTASASRPSKTEDFAQAKGEILLKQNAKQTPSKTAPGAQANAKQNAAGSLSKNGASGGILPEQKGNHVHIHDHIHGSLSDSSNQESVGGAVAPPPGTRLPDPEKRPLREGDIEALQREHPGIDVRAVAENYLNWSGSARHIDKLKGLRNQLASPAVKAKFPRREYLDLPEADVSRMFAGEMP